MSRPKEKAKEIFSKFMPDLLNGLGMSDETFELNKKFALIVCDEMLNIPVIINGKFTELDEIHFQYWNEVKQEILAL